MFILNMAKGRVGVLKKAFDVGVLAVLFAIMAVFSSRPVSFVLIVGYLIGLCFKPGWFKQKQMVFGPGTGRLKGGVLKGWDFLAYRGFYVAIFVYSLLNLIFNFHPFVLAATHSFIGFFD